jgi:hypothetical protein
MEWYEAINWGVCISSMVFGWYAGRNYAKYRYGLVCIGSLLFTLRKLHSRGVYLSPYDQAVINLSVVFYMENT